MNCASCDICVYHLWFVLCFVSGVFLSSRVTGACPVTTDLIMRVNVRTTTSASGVCCCGNRDFLKTNWIGVFCKHRSTEVRGFVSLFSSVHTCRFFST